jgi:hypothetical protein
VPDEDLKYVIGWAQVGVLGLNIFVNCFGVITGMVKDTVKMIKARYYKLKRKFKPAKLVQVNLE